MTATIVTPTSAITACHIVVIPAIPSNIAVTFINIAKVIFVITILLVFFFFFYAVVSFDISSVIITTSDASMAESDPMLPILIPISALIITGASLIPSPTNAIF